MSGEPENGDEADASEFSTDDPPFEEDLSMILGSPEGPEPPDPDCARYCLMILQGDGDSAGGQMDAGLTTNVRVQLEDMVTEPRENVEIDVWLESPGGSAHTAYKLGVMLRAYASRIRIIVPDFAKSAATLLALCGDEIFMGPAAELGPLDAQISNEQGGLVNSISALDVARSLEDLTQNALSIAVSGGALIHRQTGVGRIETVNAMLRFSARFMEPIVKQLDPREIHQSTTLLAVAQEYANRLLKERDRVPGRGPDPTVVAAHLVENYPTHGFVITLKEARLIGLPVHPIDQYDFEKPARAFHREWEMSGTNVVFLQPMDAVEADEEEEQDD